ncbi:MAG: sigma-54 dependent transcriptional regulator [Kiritimatiellia bacterium]
MREHDIRIAIVDDYRKAAETIAQYLRATGCEIAVYTDPVEFLDDLAGRSFDMLVTDIRMPELDGISLLKKVKERNPEIHVIVVSAHAEKKEAIEALKHGAYDFFEKPVNRTEILATIERTLGYVRVLRERNALCERLSLVTEEEAKKWGIKAFVGQSKPIIDVLKKIRLLQKSRTTNMLVCGESGTGKELVARAVHFGSDRAEGPFVAVNCSAIPHDLAESILFGHVKGAFTGATENRVGQFELANGGTLFLDEIGDMPALLQTKLLRVIEDGMVVPVGKTEGRNFDVGIISATNTDIEKKIHSGDFRSDLYHRLAGYVLTLPPLRERPEDIPALVNHFVNVLADEMGIARPEVDDSVMNHLKNHKFSGNVRELRNIVERMLIDSAGNTLKAEYIQLPGPAASKECLSEQATASGCDLESLPFNLENAEKILARRAVDHSRGNIAEASRLLGISRAKVYRLLD